MKHTSRSPLHLAPFLLVLTLGACGGGGGGSNSSNGDPSQPSDSSLLAFTGSNTKAAAILSLISVDSTTAMLHTARSSADQLDAELSQPAQGPNLGILTRDALAQAQSIARTAADQPSGSYRGRVRCPVSGSVEIVATLASPGNYTVGDRLDLGYNSCVSQANPLNGVMSLEIGEVTGDPASDGTLTATMRYVDLLSGTADSGVNIKGEARFFLSRSPGQAETGWLRTGSLTHAYTGSGRQATLSTGNLDLGYTVRPDGFAFTVTQTMSLDFPAAKGKVELTTSSPLLANQSGQIFGGKLKIRGNGSTQYVDYLGADTVRLQTDVNNDTKMDFDSIASFADLYYLVWRP